MKGGRRGAPTASGSPTCRATRSAVYAYNMNKLAVVPAVGRRRVLTAALDRPAASPVVTKSHVPLYATRTIARLVARVPAAGGEIELLSGRVCLRRLHSARTAAPRSSGPTSARRCRRSRRAPATADAQNDAGLKDAARDDRDFTATAKDGTVVNGLLTKPAETGRKYPLVLAIHGGPNGQDDHSFDFDREWIAANGYPCSR